VAGCESFHQHKKAVIWFIGLSRVFVQKNDQLDERNKPDEPINSSRLSRTPTLTLPQEARPVEPHVEKSRSRRTATTSTRAPWET